MTTATANPDRHCDECHKPINDYSEIGYDGPVKVNEETGRIILDPENEACSPFLVWRHLCHACAEKFYVG